MNVFIAKLLTSIVSFIIEAVLIILAIIWHLKHPDEEDAIIALVGFCATPLLSVMTYFAATQKRPNLDFNHEFDNHRRYTRGITSNNPPVIEVGITPIEQHWDLAWFYILEVRNNSSVDAHRIKMHYLNIPPQTTVLGEVGAIEPILANEMRHMRLEVRKRFVGTGDAANEELNNSPDTFFNTFKINATYVDEYQTKYSSIYNWKTKEITYTKNKALEYTRIVIAIIALIILLWGLYNYWKTEIKSNEPKIKTNLVTDSIKTNRTPKHTIEPILKSEPKNDNKPISTSVQSTIKNDVLKKDTVTIPPVNIKAEKGSIATYGQIGDNTIINNNDKPEPTIEFIKGSINEKVTTIPINFDNVKLPNEKYNYPFLFKSTITVKYYAPQVLNGFGFLSGTSDVVLMISKHQGNTNGRNGIYYGKKYISVMQPENGVYTFSAYTTKEIKSIAEVFNLLK